MIIAPISRILARWIGGLLIGFGLFAPHDMGAIEPDLAFLIAAVIGVVVEGFWLLARRFGWST